jgi:hypothetical protein
MLTSVQFEAFKEEVRKYHDRPIEFIPRTKGGTTYGGVDLVARMKREAGIAGMTTPNTSTLTSPIPFLRLDSEGDVSCGGHRRNTCAECPIGDDGVTNHGSGWCNGDCTWNTSTGTCEDKAAVVCNVSCGGHCAADCAGCGPSEGEHLLAYTYYQ